MLFVASLSREAEAQRKRVRNGRSESRAADPKPGDLAMARLKVG